MPDSLRIDAAYGEIECNAAKDLDVGNDLGHQVGKRSRVSVVVLEEKPAHAIAARQARCFDRVDGSGAAIRRRMDVEIDHPLKLRLRR